MQCQVKKDMLLVEQWVRLMVLNGVVSTVERIPTSFARVEDKVFCGCSHSSIDICVILRLTGYWFGKSTWGISSTEKETLQNTLNAQFKGRECYLNSSMTAQSMSLRLSEPPPVPLTTEQALSKATMCWNWIKNQ
ncbi:hypothetical protein TNCV_843091 [Trichonephila clavipes]|nr:hypothetical protein TNCV_843091 [Trichonephila clavipes]